MRYSFIADKHRHVEADAHDNRVAVAVVECAKSISLDDIA